MEMMTYLPTLFCFITVLISFTYNAQSPWDNVAEFEGKGGVGFAFGFAPTKKVLINFGYANSGNVDIFREGVSFSF